MSLHATTLPTPIGTLTLLASDVGLVRILWDGEHSSQPARTAPEHPVLAATARQLTEYFAGTRDSFDLPLDPAGTDFQRRVWTALAAIPHGQTCSYGAIAQAIGRPTASRAVGAANGRNPLPIVIPCHRVVGASGALTGFGGGMATKRYLLDLERGAATLPSTPAPASALGR